MPRLFLSRNIQVRNGAPGHQRALEAAQQSCAQAEEARAAAEAALAATEVCTGFQRRATYEQTSSPPLIITDGGCHHACSRPAHLSACLPACLCASQAELARVAARDEAREARFREAQRCGAAYDHVQVLRPLRSGGGFGGL
eukprot:COSAG01_NODE_3828_length_5655_cov_3.721742_3_plen_142_part_00